MDKDQVKAALSKFFGDTGRSRDETREGLEEVIELAESYIETLDEQ